MKTVKPRAGWTVLWRECRAFLVWMSKKIRTSAKRNSGGGRTTKEAEEWEEKLTKKQRNTRSGEEGRDGKPRLLGNAAHITEKY